MNIDLINRLADEYERELPPFVNENEPPKGAAIAGWIDHTILKADATKDMVMKLCDEARQYEFATVCVNPVHVSVCSSALRNAKSKVCSVIGFPLGTNTTKIKVLETQQALDDGASEIDMVINIGALKSGDIQFVLDEILAINEVTTKSGELKVIVENCYLSRREKILASIICREAGVGFIKTSTGFGPSGAMVEDVELMRRIVGPSIGVKAAGGIRTYADAMKMIAAGANRIGASASIAIVSEAG